MIQQASLDLDFQGTLPSPTPHCIHSRSWSKMRPADSGLAGLADSGLADDNAAGVSRRN
jgi:hypothetical protein